MNFQAYFIHCYQTVSSIKSFR